MLKPFYCLCLGMGLTMKSITKLEPKIQVINASSYHSHFLPRMLMSSCSLCLESRSTTILMNVASANSYSTSQGRTAWFPKLSKSSRILQLLMLSHQEFCLSYAQRRLARRSGEAFVRPHLRICNWIIGEESGNPPSCPSCRAPLPRVG